MILVAEMKNGGAFEAESKNKLTAAMIEYFGNNDEQAEQIKAIYCVYKDDRCREFSGKIIEKIQAFVETEVSRWRKIADQELEGQRDIEDELRGNLF